MNGSEFNRLYGGGNTGKTGKHDNPGIRIERNQLLHHFQAGFKTNTQVYHSVLGFGLFSQFDRSRHVTGDSHQKIRFSKAGFSTEQNVTSSSTRSNWGLSKGNSVIYTLLS